MQDGLHWILQARARNTILYDCIAAILFFYSERIQHRSTTVVWLMGVQGCNPLPWQVNAKTEPHPVYISVFGTFLVFSKLLFFALFGRFWTVVFRWFRVIEIHIPINFRF